MAAMEAEAAELKAMNAELVQKINYLEGRLKDYDQALMSVQMAELKRTVEVINLKAELRRLRAFVAEEH